MTSNLATPNAEVALYLPEVTAAGALPPREFRVPVAARLPARAEERRPMGRGQSLSLSDRVLLPHAGYYRAQVVAVDSVTPERELLDEADGPSVQSEVHREIWLLVTKTGGRVTEEFEVDLVPEGYRPQPGPFRPGPAAGPTPTAFLAPDARIGAEDPRAASVAAWLAVAAKSVVRRIGAFFGRGREGEAVATFAAPYRYQVVYDVGGSFLPLPSARVEITHYPVFNGSLTDYENNTIREVLFTDGEGRFQVSCFTQHNNYAVGVLATDASTVRILPTTRVGSDTGFYDDCTAGTNLDRQIIADSRPSHVYRNMKSVIPASRSLLGRSRGLIEVELDPNISNSFYRISEDRIYVKSTDSADHVFGSFGLFVAAHEYGHAVHEKAVGGINPHSCPDPHEVEEPSNLSCALTEGFADYHGVATAGPGASWYATISTRDIDKVRTFSGFSSYDPAEIEGAFVAFLFDITDPAAPGGEEEAGAAHDSVAYPGSYVAQIVETCREPDDRADGTDHIVYCFEQAVRPEVLTHTNPEFFFARSSPPGSIGEAANEPPDWDLSELRSLWLHDIYDFTGARPLDGGGGFGGGDTGGDDCPPRVLRC